jgi:hypothetical protein
MGPEPTEQRWTIFRDVMAGRVGPWYVAVGPVTQEFREIVNVVPASVLEERDRELAHMKDVDRANEEMGTALTLERREAAQLRSQLTEARAALEEIDQVIASRLEANEALGVIVNTVRDGLVPAPQDREPAT